MIRLKDLAKTEAIKEFAVKLVNEIGTIKLCVESKKQGLERMSAQEKEARRGIEKGRV